MRPISQSFFVKAFPVVGSIDMLATQEKCRMSNRNENCNEWVTADICEPIGVLIEKTEKKKVRCSAICRPHIERHGCCSGTTVKSVPDFT